MVSRHHCTIVRIITISPKIKRSMLNWWNHLTSPVVSIIALMDPVSGQGLMSTKW